MHNLLARFFQLRFSFQFIALELYNLKHFRRTKTKIKISRKNNLRITKTNFEQKILL